MLPHVSLPIPPYPFQSIPCESPPGVCKFGDSLLVYTRRHAFTYDCPPVSSHDDLEIPLGLPIVLHKALHMAAANGHLEVVEYLIRNNVDVNITNAEKNTPLHWACLNGHSEVVRNLILAGADVAALNSHERTPLDEAVNMGKMDIVDVISSASAQAELEGVNIS
ncbi:ankyrin repeat-containing protein P16F5.05c isoform X2 [Nymphaea colorata]|nr:ankyrin repeat-containing protein P16F5.05c isoform X2 [Nymphaea colorata]